MTADARVRVVLFSGGRGSGALSRRLVLDPDVALTIAVNGYDDGASTGRVRRFLGDCLGPSDFRKNASHLARALSTCDEALTELLDFRLPVGCAAAAARAALTQVGRVSAVPPSDPTARRIADLSAHLAQAQRQEVADRLDAFEREAAASSRTFDYSDCAVGNLVFAGSFLLRGRDFNAAVDDYCAMVGLPAGLVENVTDGTNAYLVALDASGVLLTTEEAIVDAKRRNQIRDIFLLPSPLDAQDEARVATLDDEQRAAWLQAREVRLQLNTRLAERLGAADLIIYAPGTQHSSLFPSYLTPGLSAAIAANLRATKLLVTNIQEDAEIAGSSAVDIVERALFYLEEKGRHTIPTPALITHYLINDPARPGAERPYVPLGRLDSLDDPRLVRIGYYEDGVSGRHDAQKLLAPFLDAFVARRRVPRIAVVLHDVDSANKLYQTLLEMTRAGVAELDAEVAVFHGPGPDLDDGFLRRLPFPVERVESAGRAWDDDLRDRLARDGFDFAVLFESSGMYRGEDIVSLIAPLLLGRLDVVWGSRRLSARDVVESQRLRYRHKLLLHAASAVGSYALSLAYLLLYGRYVSDTLSGARALRVPLLAQAGVPLASKQANQVWLSTIMRQHAEFQEVYVRFVPLSPERVKRTTVADGLSALWTILWRRIAPPPAAPPAR